MAAHPCGAGRSDVQFRTAPQVGPLRQITEMPARLAAGTGPCPLPEETATVPCMRQPFDEPVIITTQSECQAPNGVCSTLVKSTIFPLAVHS